MKQIVEEALIKFYVKYRIYPDTLYVGQDVFDSLGDNILPPEKLANKPMVKVIVVNVPGYIGMGLSYE